jgi:hypothetical protein
VSAHADDPVHENTLPAVLTAENLAALLGTSVRTIEKRRMARTLPFTELPRIDRKPRWSRDQVLAALASFGGGVMLKAKHRERVA